MHRFGLLLGILIACGGDNAKSIPDAPSTGSGDAAPGPDAGPGPNIVTIGVFNPPDFVKYRDGAGGPWLDPITTGSDGSITIGVHDDYVILTVCSGSGSSTDFDAEENAFTFTGDGSAVFAGCTPPDAGSGSAGSAFTVTGAMAQAGSVQTGNSESDSGSANWTYSITGVPAGMHDLLAQGSGSDINMQLSRGLDVEADTTGPSFDIDGSGAAAPPVTFTIQNADATAQQMFGFSGFGTANDFFTLSEPQGSVATTLAMSMPPTSILQAGDEQVVELVVFGAGGQQAELFQGSGAPATTFALIPPLANVTFGGSVGGATFGALPVSTYNSLGLFDINTDQTANQQLNFTASQSWIDKLAATALLFDSSAPGFSSKWTIDPTKLAVELDINATDNTTGIFYTTFAFGGAAFDVAHHHRDGFKRHLRRQVKGASRKILP